jgi:hypothetical protein
VGEGGIWCRTPDGIEHVKGETVIYAVGQKPLAEEASALYPCAARFYMVGDCRIPGSIGEANAAAATVAMDIGAD